MFNRCICVVVIILTCFARDQSRIDAADDKHGEPKAAIGKLQQGIVDAFSKGSKALGAYLEPLLLDDAIITDHKGREYDKRRFLAMAKSGSRGPLALEQRGTKIQLYGETAVVTGLVSGKELPQEAYRMTTVFVRRGDQWRLAALLLTAVSRD